MIANSKNKVRLGSVIFNSTKPYFDLPMLQFVRARLTNMKIEMMVNKVYLAGDNHLQ